MGADAASAAPPAGSTGGDASNRPQAVLQVRSSRGLHGPERTLLELAPALGALGVRVPLLVLYRPRTGDPDEHPLVAAARAAGLEAASVRDPGPLHPAAWRGVRRALRRGGLRAVHTHDYKADLLVASARGGPRRLPWVATVHLHTATTARLHLYGRLALVAVRRADRVVAVSASQARALADAGVPPERLAVVRTAVDADAMARRARSGAGPAGARAALGVPPEAPLIALVGRLTTQKGVDVALSALARLLAAAPGARLAIAGDGPELDRLHALAAGLGVGAAVAWAGALADPLPLLAAADVVILPSRAEGLPRVALEAAAVGRPVVAAAVGGLPEAVRHGETGWLVPPEDAGALCAALERLLADPDLGRRLGDAAAADVRVRFTLASAARALADLYRGLDRHRGRERVA